MPKSDPAKLLELSEILAKALAFADKHSVEPLIGAKIAEAIDSCEKRASQNVSQ